MAITRAQQIRQMLKDGDVAVQGGAKNYLGKQKTVSGVPVKWQSGPDAPSTELAYITKKEKDLLLKKDIHGSLKDGPNTGPEGIMSLDSQGDFTPDRSGGKKSTAGPGPQGNFRETSNVRNTTGGPRAKGPTFSVATGGDGEPFIGGGGSGGSDDPDDAPVKKLQEFYDKPANYPKYTPAYLKYLADLNRKPNRKFFVERVLRAGKIPGLPSNVLDVYGEDFDLEAAYQSYMDNRMAGKTDAMGNPVAGFQYDDSGNLVGNFRDDGGPDQPIIPIIPDDPNEGDSDDTTPTRNLGGLAPRFAGSIFDFTGLADGGRVPAMGGGIMNTDVIGGFADGSIDEMGRQMYGLGKLVKKATRGIKKIIKSPIGKAALIGAGFGFAGMGPFKALAGTPMGLSLKDFLAFGKVDKAFNVGSKAFKFGNFLTTPKGAMTGIAALSALPLLFGQEEEEENFDPYRGPEIDIANIRANPYNFLAPRFQGSTYAADGGLMRTGYQEGGDAEPVAKKTMPLIDMDGKEKDYRETGGFVDMGRMERADDVPARLSKNEFVFTADAVRNAGEGDIDKGAEVMYNMMKNLEAGGEVSEKSQGLEGAREMFQTSQRLEEVL